jgi:hypothetical protein
VLKGQLEDLKVALQDCLVQAREFLDFKEEQESSIVCAGPIMSSTFCRCRVEWLGFGEFTPQNI